MTVQIDTSAADSAGARVLPRISRKAHPRDEQIAFMIMMALFLAAPFVIYPFFMMQALCFALFACAFNLLIGYVGLLSFGHAMFLGSAGYFSAHIAKVWGWPPELAILTATFGAGVLGLCDRGTRDPPARHLFRDDLARAIADDLLLLPAGAVHTW